MAATLLSLLCALVSLEASQAQLFGKPKILPPPRKEPDIIYGKRSDKISDRFFKTKGGGGSHYYGEEPVFERRLPNILDATVDSDVPTLPFEIPVQSNVKPHHFLRMLQEEESGGGGGSYGAPPPPPPQVSSGYGNPGTGYGIVAVSDEYEAPAASTVSYERHGRQIFFGGRKKRHNRNNNSNNKNNNNNNVRRLNPVAPNALDATVIKNNFRPSPQITHAFPTSNGNGNSNNHPRQLQQLQQRPPPHLQQQQLFHQQKQHQQQFLRQQEQKPPLSQLEQLVLQQLQQKAAQKNFARQQHQQHQQQVQQAQQHVVQKKAAQAAAMCDEKYAQLLGDIFVGNEIVPEILDSPPPHLLELTYRTVRTFPGMKVTADVTRFTPMVRWPTEEGALYTVVLSNLDINNRKNRSLSEFWHWMVSNVPGDDLDRGDVVLDLLHPLVLPDGDGDHRFGYFVLRQPGRVDFSREGGPTPSCAVDMSAGRGPYRSIRDLMKKYDLRLWAATFLVVDHNEASDEIACQWQKCMKGTVFIEDLDCSEGPKRRRRRQHGNDARRRQGDFWYL